MRHVITAIKCDSTLRCSGLAPIKRRGIGSTDRLFFELGRAEVLERRIAPNGVVEAIDTSGNVTLGFGTVKKVVLQTSSDFNVMNNVSTIALS